MTLLFMGFTCLYAILFSYPLQNWLAVDMLVVATAAGALTPWIHRCSDSLSAASHFLAYTTFILIVTLISITGGLESPSLMWLAVVPLLVTILNGPKSGLIWLGLVTVEAILIGLISPEEYQRLQTLTPAGARFLNSIGAINLAAAILAALSLYHFELTKAQRMLCHQAWHDGLTDLLNHRALMTLLDQEFTERGGKPPKLGLILIDIDHFKKVNDRWGHAAGNTALQQIAECIRSQLRGEDCVGRFGGEEFLCILRNCPPGKVLAVAETIRQAVERTIIHVGEDEIALTVSLGVALYDPDWENDVFETLERADTALYEAKRNGRNQTCVGQESHLKAGGGKTKPALPLDLVAHSSGLA